MKYKHKPFVVDAWQWDGDEKQLSRFIKPLQWEYQSRHHSMVVLMKRDGELLVKKGDWLIRDVCGEITVCSNWAFELRYEPYEWSKTA